MPTILTEAASHGFGLCPVCSAGLPVWKGLLL